MYTLYHMLINRHIKSNAIRVRLFTVILKNKLSALSNDNVSMTKEDGTTGRLQILHKEETTDTSFAMQFRTR